ncbi:unnamed protein product [Didymodactylos carnosus]|uniref:Uncharacterized protein n=1 Tax=Didymodactylos carnosus TaxID=1234261 RepID=A0A8S2MU56_9BILA|nr:unnamed protein product [Didymodactylos carnosus]CAF3975313.1 unnamed protein product [Didymodactylos carnosus]
MINITALLIVSINTSPASVHADQNEDSKLTNYNEDGLLPIHKAALDGLDLSVKRILTNAESKGDIQQQLEAKTIDGSEMTPLLLATAAGKLDVLQCLLDYGANYNAEDTNGHGELLTVILFYVILTSLS